MYKKLLSGILALTLCLSLASCAEGDSSSDDISSDTDTTTSAADAESSQPDEQPSGKSDDSNESDGSSEPDDMGAEGITPAMWKAQGKDGGTVYFLGSMHALTKDCYPLPDVIKDAYNSSDSLAVECDIYEYQSDYAAQMSMLMDMMYADGTTVHDHLDADLYESAKQILTDAGLYMELYDYYNVVTWSSLIEAAMIQETGLDSSFGIDMYFLNKAHGEGKNIIEIESVEFQNDLLYGQPDELGEFLLEGSVYYFEDQCDELLAMFDSWCSGDILEYLEAEEAVEAEDYEDIEISEELEAMIDSYNRAMLDDRNVGMAQKAIEMLENGENVFYVVGAAHFSGDKGIIKLLEDAGYTLEPIEY